MEQALINIRGLHEWTKRTLFDNNHEKLDQLYTKLSEQMDVIFGFWVSFNHPEMLYEIISLLLPTSQNNLFTALWKNESQHYMHPFPIANLPNYIQKIIFKREINDLPSFYRAQNIILDQGIIVLPTQQYYLFKFMYEATKTTQRQKISWSENPLFLNALYDSPFLILYSQMMLSLDEKSLGLLVFLTDEYCLKDIAICESPPNMPSRHNCEIIYIMTYILQSEKHLFKAKHRLYSISESNLLFNLQDSYYWFFKNSALKWRESYMSYCAYLAEVWIRYLTPWEQNLVLEDFLTNDFLNLNSSKVSAKFEVIQKTSPEFEFWGEYIETNLLFYTELFEYFLRLLCSDLLFRSGDINLLNRISKLYKPDSEGKLFHTHINLRSLEEMSKGGSLTPILESKMAKYRVARGVLYPFDSPNVKATAENLVHKALNTGCREAVKVKNHFVALMGIRVSQQPQLVSMKWRAPPDKKYLMNVWERPLKSDELWILLLLVRGIACGIDRMRGVDTWPPTTDLRFFASYKNLLFLAFMGLLLSILINIYKDK
ncbi:unnamed protein product [Blepharisma stoltei]|uniref:Uncharacterized protein n=1 Tax=Blepharisma stoltei TaxID=1481888 RepID=A0AAU9IXA6_9CILI|nr:unnamed protein product [Blepharisma stoltei]